MRLLVLCPHFEPDLHAATGEVMTRLADGLARRGHELTVVTALPWYRNHDVEPAWRGRPWRVEHTGWGRIVRVWPFPTDKANIGARALGFAGFTALAAGAALSMGRHDAVLAMSPPIFLGDAAWLAARRWRIPMVFNVQDIFPDVAVELGALTNERVIGAAERHERSVYRRADAITVLSEDQAANVRAKVAPGRRSKVRIIHNFVDLDRVQLVERENDYRRRHRLEGRVVVMYAGNVGLSQPFELIRAAADRFADRAEVHFVINGEGAARPTVDLWAAGYDNVTVADFVPRHEVATLLGAADLQLILLKRGLARSSTPSKLYGSLASGRAILASIDSGSEVANVIEEAGAGRSVPPEDEAAFLAALEEMLADGAQLEEMGRRGRAHVERWMTPETQARRYEELFAELVEGAPGEGRRMGKSPVAARPPGVGDTITRSVNRRPKPGASNSVTRPVLTILSGFFSPLHVGHLDMIEAGAAHGDRLLVIVNNNEQQLLKKGKIIMDEQDRLRIVQALRGVDEALIAVDQDRTVSASLKLVAEKYGDSHQLVFANGGDRIPDYVPETPVCQEHGIAMVFGVGGDDKADSSSRINVELGLEDEPSAPPSEAT